MRILVISTNVFPIPLQNYGGLEQLVYHLCCGMAAKGHQVSVIAPQGSNLPEGIELLATGVNEDEEQSYKRYKGRLEAREWDVVIDASWGRWAMMSSMGRDPELPIINWFHSDPSCYQSQPSVRYPMWVGVSKSHAENLSRAWKTAVRYVYNGIDTQFYRSNGQPRGERYCWIARWTPEKDPLSIISLSQKLKIGVDLYGDTSIVGDQSYVHTAFGRADGYFAKVNPGISREATVEVYSRAKGFLFLPAWEEMFGLAVVEAQSCGSVPIVGRRGAMPELVKDGVTGFLVDDVEQMEELIKRDAVKEIKPEAMRKAVEKRFSIERFVEDWERLIKEVSNGNRW